MAPSKRGLGWPYDNQEDAFKPYDHAIKKGELTWLFNWEMWKPKGLPAGLNYVPQVRTAAEVPQINQFLSAIGADHVDHFIGFNEPDNAGQSNLSVEQAVQLWKQHVLPAKKKFGFKLGSPAMTSSPAGKKWLHEFFHALGGHDEIDFIVLHWYGLKVAELESFVKDMHNRFKKPIWLNEFACTTFGGNQANEKEVEHFAEAALKFLDSEDFVERYAWFGAATHPGSMGGVAGVNELAHGDQLTAVGRIYCGQNSAHSEAVPPQHHPQVKLESNPQVREAAAALKPGVHLVNKSKKVETYYFFNNYWNGNGTAGANFDHPENPTTLKPEEETFVALPESFKGRVQRGKLIPATWAEFQVAADNDHKAWGDISLEQGYDGPAMIRAADGSKQANGFTNEILAGAPAAAKQKRSDGVECIASTMGNWMGGKNQAAIDYEKKVVGQTKAYIEGGAGTHVVSSKNKILIIEFY